MVNRSRTFLVFVCICLFIYSLLVSIKLDKFEKEIKRSKRLLVRNASDKFDFDKVLNEPVIFMGGYMSSGTTLMRSILDVHPSVKCGPEIKLTAQTLHYLNSVRENKVMVKFMKDAGVKDMVVNKAYGLFVYYMIMNNVQKTERICNKEPGNMLQIEYFNKTFPNSKFIFVVRDGRESAYSWITRHRRTLSFANFFKALKSWNDYNSDAYEQCMNTGEDYCKIVRYENLVQKTKETIEDVAIFLNLEWTDKFLHHEDFIKKDIRISKAEYSLSKIKHGINTKSIGKWIGNIPNYDSNLVEQKIKMLKVLNYL